MRQRNIKDYTTPTRMIVIDNFDYLLKVGSIFMIIRILPINGLKGQQLSAQGNALGVRIQNTSP